MNEMEMVRPRMTNPKSTTTTSKTSTNTFGPSSVKSADATAGQAWPSELSAKAIEQFEEGEKQDPVIAMLMKNADILMAAKDYRLATNLLRNVLMRAPESSMATLRMGVCLRETGKFEEASKCFRALTRTHLSIDAQLMLAETLYMGERDDMSLATYREVLKKMDQDPAKLFSVYKNIGNIHVRKGDFDAAEEFYAKAFTIDANSDVLLVNFGTLEIQRGNLGEAVEHFRAAVEINPQNDKGWVGLALIHRQMGDLELAWANVQRAMDINKMNRAAIRLSVDWGADEHNFGVAITRLQDYLEVEGEDAEMSFTLAKILTHVGQFREARIELERVLTLDPSIEGAENLRRALDKEIVRRENTEKVAS